MQISLKALMPTSIALSSAAADTGATISAQSNNSSNMTALTLIRVVLLRKPQVIDQYPPLKPY